MQDSAVKSIDELSEMSPLRRMLNSLLFDTRKLPGKITNMAMLILIMVVVLVSMLNTVDDINARWGEHISHFELIVLYAFAIEYGLRIYAAHNRRHYVLSFNGIVDLLTVLPLLVVGQSMVVVRLLRLARVIRVAISLPVVRSLFASLRGSIRLLMGVLGTIALISVMVGNMIAILEPKTFSNAFEGTWWALVTMSTVGYGDFVPQSAIGKSLAAALIMAGICMFSTLTAVISVKVGRMIHNSVRCPSCRHGISPDYLYCPHCAVAQDPIAEPSFPEDDR